MEENQTVEPFGLKDKLGYMFGDFGNDFTFILSSTFLMKFYTDVMGVSGALVGLMMMLARFVDAFTDVTMGQITDRSKPTAKGKFLPWIRRMSGPVAVASFLMYAVWFKDMSMEFKIFWMFFSYLLWGSVFYTSVNIPYGSMVSAISGDPTDRAQLSNWRTIGSQLAAAVIGIAFPLILYYSDANGNLILSGNRMCIAALLCSIAAVVCYMLCYRLTTERVKVEQVTERFSLLGLVTDLAKNRALIGIVISSVCFLLAQLTLSAMLGYVFPNYFRNVQAQSASGIVGLIVIFICATFTVKLSEKLGRKETAILGSLISAVTLLVAYFVHTDNAWVFLVFYAISFIGLGIFNLICWAMITDVIDDTEVRMNERADGTIYAVYSFARKLGQAASSGLTGSLLTYIGYSQDTAFDQSVVEGIYNITCLAPAIGFILLALALFFLYPLGKRRVQSNAEILAEKYGKTS